MPDKHEVSGSIPLRPRIMTGYFTEMVLQHRIKINEHLKDLDTGVQARKQGGHT